MNLDEEFEKMYGGSGAVSAAPDLEDEFAKLYGGETKPKFDLDAQSNVNELPDWQRKRISEDEEAERGYNYVMENRRKRQSEPENPETQTRLDQAIRSDGREYGRKDGEDFMTWAKRNKIHVNKKNHDGWMDYYRFEAPDMPEFPEVSPGIVDYKKMGESVAEAAQEKQRVEMAAKNASAKRRREFVDELEQKGIKEGSFVQFVGKDGETENRFYNGLNEEGRPVFSVAHGKLSKMTSKYKLDLDKFRDLMDEGNAKREDNPLESVRRGVAHETGEDVGVGKAVAERAVPFVGRAMRDMAVEQMKNLSKLYEGDLSYDETVTSTVPSIAGGGALPQTQTRRLGGVEAVERMAKSIWNDSEALRAEGEDENAYISRVRERATGELKNRVAIQQKAGREEAQVEQGAVDKIVKGGVDSAGYALEFTIAGLPFAPLGPVGAMVGSAAIETAASAPSRQLDLTTPSWALDEKGNLVKTSRAMDEDQAKWQAIVGAAAENATEVALEAATLGTLRFAGGWLRKGAKAVAPKGVGAAEAKVAEFMQSDTGLKLMSIGKHYRQFSDRTQINAPWSELAEEHVQRYFDDVVGLGKKPDDYKGFDKESAAFWNDMKSLSYHADTLYGLLGQLAVGGAHAGLAASRDAIDREKVDDEVVKALKRAGISDEAINSLDLEQRVTLCDLWARSKGKPETIKKEIDALDFAVRNVARRALADEAEAARKTVAERGETPVTFNIPVAVGKNGKQTVQFEQIGIRDTWTGQEASVRAVLDRQNGVGIVDRGDGLYEAVDTMGGSQVCDNLDDAINAAKDLAVTAQQRKSDREVKKAVIENERANNYGKKNVVYFNTIGDAATQIGEEIAQNGEAYGMSDISQLRDPKNVSRAGFHTADGTTVVILDNVRSPNDIPRLLGHEIIGHGGANGEFGNSQGADKFAGKIRSDDFDSFKEASAKKHQSVTAGETIKQAREAVNANLHEVFAHYAADAERGKPRAFDRLAYAVNIAARKIRLKKTYSDADVRVLLNKWRESAKGTGGETTGSKAERFAFFDVEQPTAPAETHENASVSASSEKGTTSRPTEEERPAVKEEGKSAPSKPVNERNIVEKLTDKAEAQEIPLSEVEVSDSRIPQFKEGADPETGEVEPLTGEPYDLVSNPIVVMEFKDGKKVVVTGRHRYGLYKRSGRKTIAARVIREADGWTVKDAMAIDAIGNIIDEKGTEKDYVKYFDEAKPTRDEAKSAGFLDRPKGQRAFSIYEGATADTKQLIDWEGAGGDGKISVDQAGIISSAAPKGANPRFGAVQRILTQKALGGLRGKKLGILARSLAEEAKNRKETPKVGGEMQLDLFTSEEDQALLALEDKRADYRVKKSGEYNRIADVLRTAVSKGGKLDLNGEYAKELGITDPKDKKQLIAARDKAIELANYWENAVVLDEADKTSMDEFINAKSGAEAAKREEIQKKAAEKLAAVKEKRTGKKPKDAVSKTETTTQATDEKKSEVEKPKSVPENQKSVSEKPKSVIKKPESVIKNGENVHAEPKTKMKNAAEEAKAQKLEDDLAALFSSDEYNPSASKNEVSKWRQFDVKKPDGERGSVHAYTMRQAYEAAKRKYGLGSVVYEQGGLENAIIRERERRARERNQQIHERYPVGAGVLGPDFAGAVKAALDGGTAQQVASLLVQANQGRVQRSALFAIGRREKLTDSDGATYYKDGTVVVQLHDGKSSDPLKFNRELLRVLANADAFGNLKDIEFLRGNENRIYGMMKGAPVASRVYPSSAEVEKFLDGAGFSKVGVHPRYPGMIWKKGLITLNQNNLRFGSSEDGKLIPLFSKMIGTYQNVGIDFASDEFDPAIFQKRVGVLAELAKTYVDNGVGKFDTLAERLYARFGEKFDSMKPYLRGIWNAVAEQLDLPEVSREQANEIFDKIEAQQKEAQDGETRTAGQTNGDVLDESRTSDGTQVAEGGDAGGSSDRDRDERPVSGSLDGGGRHAADVPVVGHDVERSAWGVPAGDGKGGRGDAQEDQDAPQDAGAVAGGRGPGAEERVAGLDTGISDGVRKSGSVAEAAHAASPDKPSNYVITAEDEAWLNTYTPTEKVANNMAVIKLLASLAEEGRTPTPEERTMMARYVGFGGFPQIVDQKYKDAYKNYGDIPSGELPVQTQAALKKLKFGLKGFDIYREMRQYLTPEEFDAIRQAMINAFYTPIDVCRSMHNALKASGFNGGRMLETSAGVGNMVGTGNYDGVPHWTAIELDKTTGKILEYLYPEANVKIQGFQDVIIPKNFIDATISNVPFSNDIHPYDPEYAKYNFNLHDYFFAKTVDTLRPGGVAALISSTGTLDKTDKTLIRFMEEHGGQIVGALRLPNGHQHKNSGTEVAADIIFIQKVNGRADNSAFSKSGQLFGIKINDYFVQHPEMIFGTPEAGRSMYGNAPALKFKATRDPSELDAAIRKAAEGLKYLAPNEAPASAPLDLDEDKTGLRRGNIGVVDGKIVKREGDVIVPIDVERMTKPRPGKDGKMHRPDWPEGMTKKGHTLAKAVQDVVRLRNAYHEYVEAQKHGDEETVKLKRASLNAVYDVMQSNYGHFNDGAIAKVFDLDDADGIILQNLEAYDVVENGKTPKGKPKFKKVKFRKSDTLLKRTLFRENKVAKADNVLDGLRISLNENGGVNLARIAELTGKSKEAVSAELMASGHVFQNPSTGGLETRDEYLSGSVRRKLREARAAAEVDPSFRKNIEELEKVQPEDKPATKIKYQLGQKFIPNEMYVQFLSERIFGTPENPARKVAVGYDEKKDTWVVSGEGLNSFWRRKCPDGTHLEEILVRIFNGSSLTVKDRVDDGGGKYHYVPNPQKTQAVEALRDDLTAELSKWMVATPERAKQIERAYNDKMNDNVERKFDTSLLTLDGISDDWAKKVNNPGYEHQKRSITRGVFGGNLYIQHCVGAGKSFEMFSICMQLRRLGLARKPMLTVPNHMVESGQVLREFKEAYPGANILVATTKDLNSTNRRKFLAKAANGDWDCIVVPHSSFSLIGMDPKVQADYIRQEIEELREMLESDDGSSKKKGNQEKRIEKKIASKMEKMKKLLDQSKKDSTVPFENIGVDYLFVDEAHNFKGLDITTKMSNVSGVTGSVSQRAQDLEMKCRYLSKLHSGDKGVIFASGTPISNSISESYTNMRFMNPTRMREMGIYRFDDWAKSFGVVETKAAPRASGKGYQEKTRFARFQNLVELKQGNFAYADIVLDGDLNIPRPFMAGIGDDGKPVLGKPIVHKIPATDFQKKYVESLDKRLDSFKGKFDPKIDNPLKVVTEGRLLAIDPALLGLKDEHRRLETIADNVFRIWQKSTGITGKDKKTVLDGTQLIFCDSGVPKPKKFSKVVRTADGGFATKSANVWSLYVSDVDANGMRHGKAVRSDGASFSVRPFADHGVNGMEDISSVYAAFDEMAQRAADFNKKNKSATRKYAPDPVGEQFDINAWLDENAEAVGYDVRFENPYASERAETADFDEIDEAPEEEIVEDDGEDEDAPEKDQDEANNGDIAVENMLRGKFNIYAYLKKALIKRGVPAEEIAFIHDAEDARAKRKLFERFNAEDTNFRGGPRILIGNTPKMGEGANVQKRLVAIHHADIPWKPAWLIQRDGRGIRAGNLNESIGIHRYVTENTFDVYSYDKVSSKQQFINQVQSHDMSQDEVEDVDDAVLAAEEAKAAAAGPIGKYMMAKTKLEQGIRKAELTLANQQSDIFNAQSGLEWDEQNLQTANRRLEADKAMLDKFAAAKGDQPFGIEVIDNGYPEFGKTLTDNDELQQFLMKKVNEYVRKGAEDGMIGKLYGMPVWWKEIRGQEIGRLTIVAIGMESQDIPIINRVAPIAKSTVSTFKAAVTQATSEKRLDRDRADVANAQKRFDASKDALAKLKIDETLPTKIEDMKIELATTMNILKAKDDRIQAEARKILNERIEQGRNAEAASIALAELNRPQPIERQLMDLEKEAAEVEFDSPEFDPEAEEKTFGITNEDEKFMLEAASMPVPKHVTKADDVLMVQAEHLLSNRDFMRKLAHAVAQKARPTSDAQNVALGIYSEQCADALNAAKQAYDDMVAELELLPPDADQETVDVTKKSIAALRKELAGARRDFREAAMAKRAGASELGRALRTNRFLFSTADYSYAGLRGIVQSEIGKAEIPEEMDAEIGKLAENFKDLDERFRNMAVERLKLFSQKIVNDLKAGGRKASSSGPKAAGNELKRVMRNYEDALNQVQVHADEAGGTLIGMSDQLYPSWGKWLKAIGEYHCYLNPDITEQGVIDAIREDLGRYLTDGIDEETVRDVLTGFGHNYRQSRYDSQRKMNDLKAQALSKRQRDYMIENGKLPPQTGMVRDEPSDETRALRKEVQQIKKDIDEQEGGPRALKGALASAKTRVRNTIADLENAIARGERIERSHRTLMEDAELQQLKKRRDELREEYEAIFGEKSTLTDEQRLQRTEKMLRKTLERALERLGRAYGGDFSTAPRVRLDNATTAQLREEIANTNRIIRDLKDAAYPMGTPEEIAKRNANRMKRREEAIQRLQARIISGDIRPQAKPVPPMPPDMQKQYDALGDQMKAAHRRLQQLREEARHATWFAVPRAALDGFNYMVGSIMTNAASYDRSAVLRQALRLTAAKPVDAAKAYVKAEKAAWNENYFNEVNDKLLADPIIDEGMKKYGLRLHSTDIAHIHTIELFKTPNSVEPRFITRIGQMIGGIPVIGKIGKGLHGAHTYIKAGSERHYVTYLNLMAGQTYKLLVDAVPGGASDFQKRKFAGLVNILTGSASMPENVRHGINMVNTIGGNVAPVIWSPSLWVSQIEQVVPIDVFGAYFGKKDDVKPGANAYAEATYVAKEAMKLRIRAGLAIAALGALLSYALGDDDWWNELVADARRGNLWRVWNKIHHPVIGKTHIDLEMGERTFSKTIGAFVTTKTETSTGRTKELGSYGTGDWYSMLGRYAGGKISPMYSAIIALRFGRDYVGNPYGFKEFASSWIPLSVGDVFQSAMEDSWLDGTAPVAVAMTMLGAGGSVYDEKYYERTVNPFLESVKDIEKTVSDPLLDREEKDLIVKNIREAAGGIFSDDHKWREAYVLARQISAADGKLKKSIKQFETAQASGRKFDETSAVKNIEKATGALDAQKRRLMEMIQQGKDNYFRPWRR